MTVYDLVKSLLEKKLELRDSDKRLTWEVWRVLGFVKNNMLLQEAYYTNSCPTPESVTRARRMVQEKFPSLQASLGVKKQRSQIEKSKGRHVMSQEVSVRPKGEWVVNPDGRTMRWQPS